MQEYKMAKGWALFIYLACPLLIGVCLIPIAMWLIPAWREEDFQNYAGFLIPLMLFFIAFMVVAIIDTAKGRVIIDQEKIYTRYIAFNSSIALSDIKGFRIDDRYLYIESKTPGVKRVKITLYYGKLPELIDWLAQRYPDLDELEAEKEFKELTQDNNYGFTDGERQERFQQAGKIAKVINWAGGLCGAWVLFWPEPYSAAIVSAMIIPLAAVGVLKYFKGLVRLDERKNSPYPSVFFGFMLSSLGLALRALFDYNLYDHGPTWLPILLGSTLLAAIIFINNPEIKERQAKDWMLMLVVFAINVGYFYGLLVSINCNFGGTNAVYYPAEIINKDKSTGKTTAYYFELSPWGPRQTSEEIQVSREMYEQMEPGDSVKVLLLEGALGFPWVEVVPKRSRNNN